MAIRDGAQGRNRTTDTRKLKTGLSQWSAPLSGPV